MTEEEALAILLKNLKKRKKISDPLRIAEACRYLSNLYGSYSEVADRVGVSSEIIREFVHISKLSENVKKLIQQGLIQGVDIPYRISRIEDKDRQFEIAKAVIGLKSHIVREIVEYARRHEEKSAEECKEEVLKSKGETIEIHTILIPFDTESSEEEIEHAIKEGLKPKRPFHCKVKDSILIISLHKEDFDALKERARASGGTIEGAIEEMLRWN